MGSLSLDQYGNAEFSGKVMILKELTQQGDAAFLGVVNLTKGVSIAGPVKGDVEFASSVTIKKELSQEGTAIFKQQTLFEKGLTADGPFRGKTAEFSGKVLVDKKLQVNDDVALNGTVTIEKELNQVGMSSFNKVATFNQGLLVKDEANFKETANFTKNINVTGSIFLNGVDIISLFCPTGTILPFAGTDDKVPPGFLLCDGKSYPVSLYQALHNVIGNNWGTENINMFNVPDLRGTFLRGVSGTANLDPNKDTRVRIKPGGNKGNSVGSYQNDDFLAHNHPINFTGAYPNPHIFGTGNKLVFESSTGYSDQITGQIGTGKGAGGGTWLGGWQATIDQTGGSETRPKNVYVNYIIKN